MKNIIPSKTSKKVKVNDIVAFRNHYKNKSKTDPYRIVEISETNATLENPFVGKDSKFEAHIEDLFPSQESTSKRKFSPNQEIDFSNATAKQTKQFEKWFSQSTPPSTKSLIGKKIQVYWSQTHTKGWWKGQIVDFEPRVKSFWIRYKIPSDDGTECYAERLVGNKAARWKAR